MQRTQFFFERCVYVRQIIFIVTNKAEIDLVKTKIYRKSSFFCCDIVNQLTGLKSRS